MSLNTFNGFGLSIEGFERIIKDAVASELNKAKTATSISQTKEKDLLTRKEAIELLNISYTSLWRYCKKNLIQPKKLGGKIYFSKSELLNLLNEAA